jgi:FHS family L-fucose permease-like MFS transporter
MKVVKPRYILLTYMSGIIAFIATAFGTKDNTGIAMLSLVLFFESCIFPTIFTLSLRGLGRHTKRGASFPVSLVSGGCISHPCWAL